MANRHLSLEIASYIVVLILSFWVRWITLDNIPLSDFEADLALRSLAMFDGEVTSLSPQPGYVTLTGLLFFVGKETETLSPGGLLFFRFHVGSFFILSFGWISGGTFLKGSPDPPPSLKALRRSSWNSVP